MTSLLRKSARCLPTFVKQPLRDIRNRYRERRRVQELFGPLAPMVPPESLMHDGPPSYEEFKKNGEDFLKIYQDIAGLKPDDAILDIGCGIGRKTIRLTEFLNNKGRYEGLDIVQAGIDWCSRTITSRHPNFRFQLIDVYNKQYNPTSKVNARDYRLPYGDATFDLVVLGSVFTHMLTPDVEHYLAEIKRVLKPGGRSLISWFLIDAEVERLIAEGRSTIAITHDVDQFCRTVNPEIPEHAIGFQETYVGGLYRRLGFQEGLAIYHGSWSSRTDTLTYQDQVVARA